MTTKGVVLTMRVDDLPVPHEGSECRECAECAESVWVAPETLRDVHNPRYLCLQCFLRMMSQVKTDE